MSSADIEKIRVDGSSPTGVVQGVRAISLFFAGDQPMFAGSWMGDAPLFEVTAAGGIHSFKED